MKKLRIFACHMILAADIFGFLQLGLADLLDILMVALLIYVLFRWIRGSAASNILLALVFLLLLQVVVNALNMRMTATIMNALLDVGVLALIIIFQPEIRHFLNRLGSESRLTRRGVEFFGRVFGIQEIHMDNTSVTEITEACRSMSAEKCGALIVIPHKTSLQYVIETGDRIDALVHRRLIRNLFFKNSPLHDGAMVISGNRIVAARCTLPITARTDIPAQFGMRHKAAIGMSEESDADIIVVSEETGRIVFVHGGTWTTVNNINELTNLLLSAQGGDAPAAKP